MCSQNQLEVVKYVSVNVLLPNVYVGANQRCQPRCTECEDKNQKWVVEKAQRKR
jgi:hypothetical protein